MAYPLYQRRKELFEGTSGNSSTYTSAAQLVCDYAQMSLSWQSSGADASRLTIWATNEDGLRSSLNTWSVVTGLTAQGVYVVEPGIRWLRVTRQSADSLSEVYFQGRT